MNTYLKLLIIVMLLTNCEPHHPDVKHTTNDSTTKVLQTHADEAIRNDIHYFRFGTNYSILTFNATDTWLFPADSKGRDIMGAEEEIVWRLALQCIDSINVAQLKRYNDLKKENHSAIREIIDIKNYKAQIMPIQDRYGHLLVWANFFCHSMVEPGKMDWKNNIVRESGRGLCNFNLKVNVTMKRFYDLNVNR